MQSQTLAADGTGVNLNEITHGIIGESSQVYYGIKPLQVRSVQIPNIFTDLRNLQRGHSEIAACV